MGEANKKPSHRGELLTRQGVADKLGVAPITVDRRWKDAADRYFDPKFPKPVTSPVNGRAVGWRPEKIEAYVRGDDAPVFKLPSPLLEQQITEAVGALRAIKDMPDSLHRLEGKIDELLEAKRHDPKPDSPAGKAANTFGRLFGETPNWSENYE